MSTNFSIFSDGKRLGAELRSIHDIHGNPLPVESSEEIYGLGASYALEALGLGGREMRIFAMAYRAGYYAREEEAHRKSMGLDEPQI
jgi:hypothetical protein